MKMDSQNIVLSSSKVFLCNEGLLDSTIGKDEIGINLIKLRHPKFGSMSMYSLSKDKKLYEVLQMNDGFRSWFADEIIIKDGSLFITSQVNPVYLILPYLNNPKNVCKFIQLDDILEDEEFPNLRHLNSCDFIDLANVVDTKVIDDISFYRFNKEKTMNWLERRVHFIKAYIKEKNVVLNPPSAYSEFDAVPIETPQESEYLMYSYGLLSEYLDDQLSNDLYDYLKLNESEDVNDMDEVSPPHKKIRVEEVGEKQEGHPKSADLKKTEKMTIAQRRLSKIDKQGMKSISSFFALAKNNG